eukprot:GEMP01085485.1.p2 GENE.GEMP01085485.1~~GEMP01085485.1.p2  ORF type:complete len:105 (-),score=2.94 GEMP01085485.1:309-623(-)
MGLAVTMYSAKKCINIAHRRSTPKELSEMIPQTAERPSSPFHPIMSTFNVRFIDIFLCQRDFHDVSVGGTLKCQKQPPIESNRRPLGLGPVILTARPFQHDNVF